MEITVIYSLPSDIQEVLSDKNISVDSFFDELSKIAEVSKDSKFKRWLKASAVLAAGQGVGHGIAYMGDRFVSKAMHNIPSDQRMKLRLVAGTLAGLGASYAY